MEIGHTKAIRTVFQAPKMHIQGSSEVQAGQIRIEETARLLIFKLLA